MSKIHRSTAVRKMQMPERDLVALFYQNMQGPAKLHPQFYERAYRLFDASATPAPATKRESIALKYRILHPPSQHAQTFHP
jgi:hypothetical protein